jgi:class 3 adenylate cyclase/tetratricopeptide (TPR) repeat protein
MKCPKCQHENPEDAKFCNDCANKLELVCPECGKANPLGSKFCNECAFNLAISAPEPSLKALSFDEKLDRIQRYLPKGLTEKILSQRGKIEGERKQVTVMFCDMEGFSRLTQILGPEEAYGIMDQVYELLIHRVHDYEGTVNEMTGDGIMALFGAPIALEDAPQRAIRSALAIHREMAKFSEKIKEEQEGIPPLKMRIGVHTGPVVVGTLGNNLRVEFKVVGDTVNLASRMEGLADPGAIYITQDTFKLTEGLFRFEALGEKEVKGKEEPVKIYRAIAPSTSRTKFDVSAERGLTPFVGRERELELLLDGFERSKAGRGQAFSIVAEAGVGKSRLLYEFRKAVSNEDVTFLEGKCLSYSRGVAYHPVIDILKSNFDIRESDSDSEIREKVKRGLKILEADEASTLPYFLELLSVKDSGIDKTPMSPEARKDRIMEAFKQITLKGSEIRSLIVAYEDLHWVDRSSEDVLKYVLESIPGARVLIIFTYRPEFVHTWGGKSYHSQLNLNRLSNRESLAMVTHLLGTEDIDGNLEELILEKTEGVPFFIEEFVRSLKDLKIIERKDNRYLLASDIQEVSIPSTIQEVIMARVDSLPEGAKEVLQTGSVIEREFSYGLIKRVTGLPEQELLSCLSISKDSELLYERGVYPQSSYIFKHALTQEVVYDSILTKRKKNLHGEIGKAIEDLYKENIDGQYEILAEHFIESENYEKGAEYSRLASKKSEKTASFYDAIAYTQKRILCLDKLPLNENLQKILIDARTALGLYLIQLNYPIEAKEAVEPVIDTALKIDYKRRLSQIYSVMSIYEFQVEEDYPKAIDHLEEALRSAEELNDVASLFFANYCMGLVLLWSCEFEKASYHFGKALEISVAANRPWGISMMKVFLSWICFLQGNIHLGYQINDEALRIAEESGDIYSKSIANITHGFSYLFKGFFEEAEQYLLKGIDLSERIDFFIWIAFANLYLAENYFQFQEYGRSKLCCEKALRYFEKIRLGHSRLDFCRIGIARAKVMNNEKDIDLESLYGYAQDNKVKELDGQMRRYIGEILLNIDDQHISEAEDWVKKAIAADERNGMMFYLARDFAFYADLLKRKGDTSKAKENFTKAIHILKEGGADGWVKKYEKEMASL